MPLFANRESDLNDEQDIIILDDDDFMQTTFNLLNVMPSKIADSGQQSNMYCFDSHPLQQENTLIDLTSCDDFDLNDLLMIHSNGASHTFADSNQKKNQTDSIKNEIDFKVFNFHLNNFESCMEEILIEDEDTDNTVLKQTEHLPLEADVSLSPFLTYRHAADKSHTSKEENKIFKCHVCYKTFNKAYNLNRHLLTHENNDMSLLKSLKTNECPRCARRIVDRSNFKKHLKICNAIQHLTIADLNIEEKEVEKPRNSSKTKKEKSLFTCEICFKAFNKKFNYHRHLRMHFLNEILNHQHEPAETINRSISGLLNTDINLNVYVCEHCARKFNEKKQLCAHRLKWHTEPFACKYCENLEFAEKIDYMRHLHEVHSVKFRFECKYCKKTFRYLSHYMQHRQTHLLAASGSPDEQAEEPPSVNVFKCDHCGKRFAKMFNLNRHLNCKHQQNKMNEFNDEHLMNTNT